MTENQINKLKSACEKLLTGKCKNNVFMTNADANDIISDYFDNYNLAVRNKTNKRTRGEPTCDISITEDTEALLYIAKMIQNHWKSKIVKAAQIR